MQGFQNIQNKHKNKTMAPTQIGFYLQYTSQYTMLRAQFDIVNTLVDKYSFGHAK